MAYGTQGLAEGNGPADSNGQRIYSATGGINPNWRFQLYGVATASDGSTIFDRDGRINPSAFGEAREVDTLEIPEWANWLAQDADGSWFAYEIAPVCGTHSWMLGLDVSVDCKVRGRSEW